MNTSIPRLCLLKKLNQHENQRVVDVGKANHFKSEKSGEKLSKVQILGIVSRTIKNVLTETEITGVLSNTHISQAKQQLMTEAF